MKSNGCTTKNPIHVGLPKLYCIAAETFLIHVQLNYDTFMVKLSGNFIYMYGRRSGLLSVKVIHVLLYTSVI